MLQQFTESIFLLVCFLFLNMMEDKRYEEKRLWARSQAKGFFTNTFNGRLLATKESSFSRLAVLQKVFVLIIALVFLKVVTILFHCSLPTFECTEQKSCIIFQFYGPHSTFSIKTTVDGKTYQMYTTLDHLG